MNRDLLGQTVTLYHPEDGQVRRQVVENCYYEWREEETVDELGPRRETRFLLILPGEQPVCIGDRVCAGCGPEVTAEAWAEFIPVRVPGLSEVAYVRPVYCSGSLCHTEAGRK